jgi:hypothetical protein
MSLLDVLNAIGHLERLTNLKLPRNALITRCGPETKSRWPPNLRYLSIGDRLCQDAEQWEELFAGWPETVKTLDIPECYDYQSFASLKDYKVSVNPIEVLDIGTDWRKAQFPLLAVVRGFPRLRKLGLTADVMANPFTLRGLDDFVTGDPWDDGRYPGVQWESPLEVLVVRDVFQERDPALLSIEGLREWIRRFPRLRRLLLPDRCLQLEEEESIAIVEIADALEQRADPLNPDSAGLFLR